jgi:hypothetical protein
MALPQPVVPKPVARSAGAAALVALLMILFGVAAPVAAADTGLGGAAGPGSAPLANAAGVLIGWGFLLVVAVIGVLFATCFVGVWVWRRRSRARQER